MSKIILILFFLISLDLYAQKGVVTGYDIPRFVSLKSDKINLRVGPSINYPINLTYIKKNYPIEKILSFYIVDIIKDMVEKIQ